MSHREIVMGVLCLMFMISPFLVGGMLFKISRQAGGSTSERSAAGVFTVAANDKNVALQNPPAVNTTDSSVRARNTKKEL